MKQWELVKGMYEYLVNNSMRPYIIVNTTLPGCCGVPDSHIRKDQRVVLDIDPAAIVDLHIGMYQIGFGARFNGAHHDVAFAPEAVEAIYGNGAGAQLVFPKIADADSSVKRDPPKLRVV